MITGLSGRYPECENVDEFKKNLYDGVDMVNDEPRKWRKGLYDLPSRVGKLKDKQMTNFDLNYFGVHSKQADCMDIQVRNALETTYEAIIDSGYNPLELRGSSIGVYYAVSNSECEFYWTSREEFVNGYGVSGCAKAMFPNRISYCFDFRGPSYAVDTACSSSIIAVNHAFNDIISGKCDAAIVVGSNIVLRPLMSLQFLRLSMLAPDGKCKAFDKDATGYVRSDAVVSIFLQKEQQARRIYSYILNSSINTDGYTQEGITFPSSEMQYKLIQNVYNEININPNDVSYMEAHGTGTKAGDPQEISAISKFFCNNRPNPLLIGSVKSNMGHSEPVAGLCAISKVILAMETRILPKNLHYNQPNPELTSIIDGRIKVVDTNTPWNGGIVGINSFGFGGSNSHLILKSHQKEKLTPQKQDLSRIVLLSGRTEEAVRSLIDAVEVNKNDDEFIGLFNTIHSLDTPGHPFRGYAIIDDETDTFAREVIQMSEAPRPIWFIYSGMGSQWPEMVKDMMKIDVFKQSIMKSAECLKPKGVDLINILMSKDEHIYDFIINPFVAITSVHIALTDVLRSLGIEPVGVVGHSAGELGCAYADGCLTTEQTILSAYYRAESVLQTSKKCGMMAAIGLSREECQKQLPHEIFIVCNNSHENVTIGGPEESVLIAVEKFKANGIFAKAVKSAGYAFHSKYIYNCAPVLQKHLEKVIPNPKQRSKRWISSSILQSGWETPVAKLCSSHYIVNNLIAQVYFHEAIQHIPENAICIEIAPHGLMQAIVKRSLKTQLHLSLMARGHDNNINFMLMNIGR